MDTTAPLTLPRITVGSAVERKRLLLIVNPHASTVTPQLQSLIGHALAGRFDLEAATTEAQGDATALSAQAAHEGFDAVVAFSGDGTINEVANGLIGTDTALGCLPGGSGNVYNKILGLPPDPIDATERLLRRADDWQTRSVRMGVVAERRFLFSSGIGLDASVTGYVDAHHRWKHRLNERYFAYAAFKVYFTRYMRHPPALETSWPGCERPLLGATTLVQKGDPYTYFGEIPLRASRGADIAQPEFAGLSLRSVRPTVAPGIAWRLFSKNHEVTDHRQIEGFTGVPELTVRSLTGEAVDVMVDGDRIGTITDAHYTIAPELLRVLA